ncbi:MAG TPA: AsmA-like C-terminal region-containing protein [Candidatus Acidoferrales bacterium]|nr:AsmA-like C-terminal region-containing protein [Candidatus Acidoferrales bacterium]
MVRSSRWLRIILAAIALLLVFDYGVSAILRSGWLNARFTHRLGAAFGRPVEVSNYSFSLLKGPRLEANYITVGEDPRFGSEYFLRADQLAVGLRLTALLRGRIELGTLSFVNPHLNLVHLPDGEWNLESWLPRPPGDMTASVVAIAGSARPGRIEISGGRVDFKSDGDKMPFALVNIDGGVEQAAPGSWRLDLQAQPFRAAVAVQQAGELRLTGVVGGTSSRLRPANLHLDWSDASLSDVLRLARGADYGIRGLLAIEVAAQTVGDGWRYTSRAELSQVHRWNLPLRADAPAVNIQADTRWVPGEGQLRLTQALIETPNSNIRATGGVEWKFDPRSSRIAVKNTLLELTSPGIRLGDLLAWCRAFHSGVEDHIALAGMAGVDLAIAGWPPRIENGSIATEGATLSGASLPDRFQLHRAVVEFTPKRILIPATMISSADGAQSFHLRAILDRRAHSHSEWTLDGTSRDVQTLFASASALGYKLPQGWLLDGPAQFRLEWKGAAWPAIGRTQGSISLAGLKIRAPFLNREITQVRGTVNLYPSGRRIQLASADAFAANWSGTLERKNAADGWQFALAADSLDAAEVNRWLNPQRREGLLDRVFPFFASTPRPAAVSSWLKGDGTIVLSEFTLAPFALHRVRTNVAVTGRKLELSDSRAEFYGGALFGSANLDLTTQPSYLVKASFRNVDLSRMAAGKVTLTGLFGGFATGVLQITANGLGRDELLHSLRCQGDAQIRKAEYETIDLAQSFGAGERVPGASSFPEASAEFACANEQVHFSSLELSGKHEKFTAKGYVDYQRRINLEFRSLPAEDAKDSPSAAANPPAIFHLAGTLKSPVFTRIPSRSAPK